MNEEDTFNKIEDKIADMADERAFYEVSNFLKGIMENPLADEIKIYQDKTLTDVIKTINVEFYRVKDELAQKYAKEMIDHTMNYLDDFPKPSTRIKLERNE
ncbi:hypothetical protein AB0X56_04330 [Weissella paramesenteroides]|uniref:hypothetical protein n=1 Tax=Weissella paramesenteroides TaxID=1249 RepID=UPI00223A8B1A|nr:hypothetical protein [Weissella paramesenteroides]MCT0485723.1 hypothetical protein [Weissella paramesenteroides]